MVLPHFALISTASSDMDLRRKVIFFFILSVSVTFALPVQGRLLSCSLCYHILYSMPHFQIQNPTRHSLRFLSMDLQHRTDHYPVMNKISEETQWVVVHHLMVLFLWDSWIMICSNFLVTETHKNMIILRFKLHIKTGHIFYHHWTITSPTQALHHLVAEGKTRYYKVFNGNNTLCPLSHSGGTIITNLIHNKNIQRSLLLKTGHLLPPFQRPLHSIFPHYNYHYYRLPPFGSPYPFNPYYTFPRNSRPPGSPAINTDRLPYVSNRFCNCDSASSCMITCHFSPHYKFNYEQQ